MGTLSGRIMLNRMRAAYALVLAIILASCVSVPEGRRADDTQFLRAHELFVTIPNVTAWNAVENAALLRAGMHAQRQSRELTVNLLNGTNRTFENSEDCDKINDTSECRQFFLYAYLPSRHLFLVAEKFYEGGVYLLIDDRGGSVTEISAEPHFGPDEQRFLVIDDDSYGSEWELQIWRRIGDHAELEWRWMSGEKQAAYPAHIDLLRYEPNDIFLEMHTESDLDHPEKRWHAKLHRATSGWELQMDSPR